MTRVGPDGKQRGNGGRSGDNVSGTQSDGSGDYSSKKRRSAAANKSSREKQREERLRQELKAIHKPRNKAVAGETSPESRGGAASKRISEAHERASSTSQKGKAGARFISSEV